MANALYDSGREGFLDGSLDWDTQDMRVLLVRTTGGGGGPYYTLNLTTDANLDDIPNNSDCRPVTAVQIASGKTVTDGVADGVDITFVSVAAGDAIQLIVIYQHTGTESTSRLIAAIDTGTNLPVTPDGNNIVIQWDSGANKIFKL